MRILLVEDDDLTAEALAAGLRGEAYSVDLATTGTAADELMAINRYDLVILDWTIPAPTGIELLRQWRGAGQSLPVLMLTGRGGLEDRVDGLDTGADDYLTKPFSPEELVLRVGAVLRRLHSPAAASGGAILKIGSIAVDRSAHTVTVDGKLVDLTRIEYRLLLVLGERRGRVQSRPQLLESVWEAQTDIQTRTVDMHVQRLRSKLGAAGDLIETVRGFGYRLKGDKAERA